LSTLSPKDLLRAYPEIDFLVAEGGVSSGYMVAIHRAFYSFAADQIRGGAVLDAGCGTGFGTALLARDADRVVGIDVKDKLLRYGREQYRDDKLDFVLMDVNRMGFAERGFDTIIADELLEHLPDHRPFMDQVVRLLRDDGLFVCATVNRAHSFDNPDEPLNRNHFREFGPDDFVPELERWFESVELLGQGMSDRFRRYVHNRSARGIEWVLLQLNIKHRIPASLRACVRSWITGVRPDDVPVEEFAVTERDIDQALYLVALARGPKRP
jgi:SAM-dependent methyltransferase